MSEAEPEPWSADSAGHVLLLLARLLLEAGADSEHVKQRTEQLAARMRLAIQWFIGSERLLLMIDDGNAHRTRIGHAVGGMGIEAGRLAALEEVAQAIETGHLDASGAKDRLSRIENARPRYPGWLVIIAAAAAASLARLFGATWPVVGAAFVAGGVNTGLRRWLPRHGVGAVAAAALTAALSGLVAALLLRLASGASPVLALVACGMILVLGAPLINGIVDLVSGHPAMGLARSASSAVIVLAIGSGLFLASFISQAAIPIDPGPGSIPVEEDLIFSAIAAFG